MNQSNDFIYYPFQRVIGAIKEINDAKGAYETLQGAGYTEDQILVLSGEAGLKRMDASGEGHGLLGRVLRFVQQFADYETDHLRQMERELKAGYFVFLVLTDGTEESRSQVRDILKAHNAYLITYFGPLYSQVLE